MTWWLIAYLACLAVLLVRVRTTDVPAPRHHRPAIDEPLALVTWHHRVFAGLLLAAPAEALLAGGRSTGRAAGLCLLAGGIALYRIGARALGDALSPFVLPRPGAGLVTHGLYRWIRHPMYLGQALIAIGAPLTLGARWTLAVSGLALGVLLLRVRTEEAALARTYPEYPQYARRSKRLLPFLF